MYDEALAGRVRSLIGARPDLVEKRMFGGLAFLVGGHMSVGVSGTQGALMVRVAKEDTERMLAEPGARPFEMHGKGAAGWVLVEPGVLEDDDELRHWVDVGVGYAAGLPPKDA